MRRGSQGLLRRRAAAAVLALCLGVALAACDGGTSTKPTRPVSGGTHHVTELTFGVFGPPTELAAFKKVVDSFNEQATVTHVTLRTWPNDAAMIKAITGGGPVPNVFLADRSNLPALRTADLNAPVYSLLDERGVDFGDQYAHVAVAGLSADNALQCMPYGVSPTMIYYNTDRVNLTRMAARGLDVSAPDDAGWSFAQFAAAAKAASRPQRGVYGVDIAPDLRSLAPFLLAGGGQVFDDGQTPTATDLSDSSSRTTLTTLLQLLRDPDVAVPPDEQDGATPLQLFERGKVGMIEGDRSLTPVLRRVKGLHFDVKPVPSLGSTATTGDVTGLCIARSKQVQASADFVVHAISAASEAIVARTGYVVPANQVVARQASTSGKGGAFLQPLLQPRHASFFNSAVGSIGLLPTTVPWARLDAVLDPPLRTLVTQAGEPVVNQATTDLDTLSRSVLDPNYAPSPSTSPGAPASSSATSSP